MKKPKKFKQTKTSDQNKKLKQKTVITKANKLSFTEFIKIFLKYLDLFLKYCDLLNQKFPHLKTILKALSNYF